MINQLGREFPDYIEGYGTCRPYRENDISGQSLLEKNTINNKKIPKNQNNQSRKSKFSTDLETFLNTIHVKDGMTVSFHHHLRNGDQVLNQVMGLLDKMGLKNLCVAASSIFPAHSILVDLMKKGTVTQIVANYISGPVAEAISNGDLEKPAIMHTHGGRSRAIESGDLQIDIAFIASPSADQAGNISGVNGPAACGALGYAISDAHYADLVVALTDTLVPYPASHIEIGEEYVDHVVKVTSIGDPAGIVSGTTQITKNPVGLKIASQTAAVIEAAGYLKDDFSFQTGAGGTSLAVAHYLKNKMNEKNIIGSFASGGITGYLVDMYESGLFRSLLDVQCFDHDAIRSYKENIGHQSMSASKYGNPHNKGCVVNHLDVMILGATEIDENFNVNVTTGSNGTIMGGSGGHSDTAFGSKLSIVVTQLVKGRIPIVKQSVTTVTTPGSTIDVLVTERGIAVNPRNVDLIRKLKMSGLPLTSIQALREKAYKIAGVPESVRFTNDIVAVVEYRDGSVIDVVRKV